MDESFDSESADPEELLDALREVDGELPFDLRRAFLEQSPEAVADGLVAVATDETLSSDEPDRYDPPAHAAALLGMIGVERAAEPLGELARREGQTTAAGEAAGRALQNLGVPTGLEAALDAYERASTARERRHLVEVLAGFDHSDRRIREAFGRELRDQPPEKRRDIVLAIERHGESEGAELIEAWIGECEFDPEEPTDRYLIDVAANVVRALGGELTDEHAALLDEARGVDGPEGEGLAPVDFD